MSQDKQSYTDKAIQQMNSRLSTSTWTAAEKMVLTCRMLASENHSETLAGQISLRNDDGTFLTTPLAVGFDEVGPEHIIRVNTDMEVLEGEGMANPAVRFHFWIYKTRPDVNCIVHTHPP